MCPQTETIARIQTVLLADAALLGRVLSCAEPASAAALISEAAANKGIELTAADVQQYMEEAASRKTPFSNATALSDRELESISAGYDGAPQDKGFDPVAEGLTYDEGHGWINLGPPMSDETYARYMQWRRAGLEKLLSGGYRLGQNWFTGRGSRL
ncbi:hypothetical protein [Polaromonas sp. YR568]|uniref:hypothetical protein n=1 Tax=Polaromonas sp. YR568 TaxID=1855301 RepID=UPI003137FF78